MLATTASRKPYLEHLALLLENEGEFYKGYRTRNQESHARNLIETWDHNLHRNDSQLHDLGIRTTADEREILRRYFNDRWSLNQKVESNRGIKPAPFTLFEQPEEKPFPQPEPAMDYSQLPDGTRLFTERHGVFIKGRRPPSNVKGFPKLLVGKELGGRPDRPVIGYQFKPDGSWEGWMEWTAEGTNGPHCPDGYTLTGYDATPSGGLIPATNQLQPTRDDQIDASLYIQPTKEITMNAIITITTKTLVNGQDVANFTNAQLYDLIAQQEKKLQELDAIKNKPKALKKELADRQAGIDALVTHLDSREEVK